MSFGSFVVRFAFRSTPKRETIEFDNQIKGYPNPVWRKIMKTRFHGVTSLGLILVATIIAALAMFQTSWALGGVYVVICVAAPLAVIYAYCAKCPCKGHCGHVFPGKIALSFNRQPGPYTPTELSVLVLALFLWLGLPQIWLWRYIELFVAFWLLNAVALTQIRTIVCRTCNNVYCPLNSQSLHAKN